MSASDDVRRDAACFFRAGVGACLVDATGRVLVLDRADVAGPAWQMPQGGLDPDEGPQEALAREVREETGLAPDAYRVVAETDWLAYELPRAYWNPRVGRGQVQRWFLCRLAVPTPTVTPDGIEFRAFEWVTPRVLLERAAPFRRTLYRRVLDAFGHALGAPPL